MKSNIDFQINCQFQLSEVGHGIIIVIDDEEGSVVFDADRSPQVSSELLPQILSSLLLCVVIILSLFLRS